MDEALLGALERAGDGIAMRAADADMEPEEVRTWVDFVLGGGGLVLCGGEGGLPTALGLRATDSGYTGEVVPAPGFEEQFAPREVDGCPTVTGAGYALLRTAGEECVLLGAPRGEGWVAFAGCPAPFLIEAVDWLAAAKRGPDAD